MLGPGVFNFLLDVRDLLIKNSHIAEEFSCVDATDIAD